MDIDGQIRVACGALLMAVKSFVKICIDGRLKMLVNVLPLANVTDLPIQSGAMSLVTLQVDEFATRVKTLLN